MTVRKSSRLRANNCCKKNGSIIRAVLFIKRRKMKRIIRGMALVLALLSLSCVFVSCKDTDTNVDTDTEVELGKMPEYDEGAMYSYVTPFEYKGLTVYAEFGESRQEALWSQILDSVQVVAYPEAQVEYYFAQERAKYRYYANRDGIDYEELISALGVSEESMRERARALVKEDLALMFIIKDAGIVLTDEEKALHTDKYAEKLAEIYGYDKEYIKTNMSEQMYDQMLSDKTMEFLLGNNTVYTTESK